MKVLTASSKRVIGPALEGGFVILRKNRYIFRGNL